MYKRQVLIARAAGVSLRLERRAWRRVLLLGLVGNALYQVVFIVGADRTSAQNAALILATVPVFVALLGRLAGLERVRARGWLGIALSLGGMVAVVAGARGAAARGGELAFGGATLAGDLLILGATLLWSLYTVLLRPVVRDGSALSVAVTATAVGAGPLVALAVPAALEALRTRDVDK